MIADDDIVAAHERDGAVINQNFTIQFRGIVQPALWGDVFHRNLNLNASVGGCEWVGQRRIARDRHYQNAGKCRRQEL